MVSAAHPLRPSAVFPFLIHIPLTSCHNHECVTCYILEFTSPALPRIKPSELTIVVESKGLYSTGNAISVSYVGTPEIHSQ
jgi:hypothetical protein